MCVRSKTPTKVSTTTRIGCWGRGASSPVLSPCGLVRGHPRFCDCGQLLAPLWLLLVVAVAFFGPAPVAAEPSASSVLLDFEGIGTNNPVGNYYGGGGGGPARDYGVSFGTEVSGLVESGAAFPHFANAPSPVTVATFQTLTDGDSKQAYVTVLGGFTALSFHYTSQESMDVTWYDGPDLTGTVLGTAGLPRTGQFLSVWENFTVPLAGGVAHSAGFSTNANGFLVDDVVIELAPPTPPPTHSPTQAPTKPPTKGPTKRPTKSPTATRRPTRFPTKAPTNVCLRGMKGAHMKRCMTKKKTV
jgi:hypothetical protein